MAKKKMIKLLSKVQKKSEILNLKPLKSNGKDHESN